MNKRLAVVVISLLFSANSLAEDSYQFKCELNERTSSSGTYLESYKYVIKKNAEIAERKSERFKKVNGKFVNFVDLADESMKRNVLESQEWKTVKATWTVDKLIFNLIDQHRNNVSEIIDRTSLQFNIKKSAVMSGLKLNRGSYSGSCKVETVNTKERAF